MTKPVVIGNCLGLPDILQAGKAINLWMRHTLHNYDLSLSVCLSQKQILILLNHCLLIHRGFF